MGNQRPRNPKGSPQGGQWAPKPVPETTPKDDLALPTDEHPNPSSRPITEDEVETARLMLQNAAQTTKAIKTELHQAWLSATSSSVKALKAPWWQRRKLRKEAHDAWAKVGTVQGRLNVQAAVQDSAWEDYSESLERVTPEAVAS